MINFDNSFFLKKINLILIKIKVLKKTWILQKKNLKKF